MTNVGNDDVFYHQQSVSALCARHMLQTAAQRSQLAEDRFGDPQKTNKKIKKYIWKHILIHKQGRNYSRVFCVFKHPTK